MKIPTKSIEKFLTSPQREYSAVLIYGVDNGLVRERVKKVTGSVLGDLHNDSFARIEMSSSELLEDPPRLADELSAVSMMCDKRVIIVRDAGDKLTKIIENAAHYFHKDNFLIIAAGELSSRSSLRKFFEKEKNCAALACYKDEARNVQSIIRQKLNDAGITCHHEVIDYLTGQLGNDRYVTYQELDKLILYAGDEKKINMHDAQQLVDYNQVTQLDDLVNAVADRNLQNLEKNLTRHLREGTQPIMYLRALQRYFQRLYDIRSKMQQEKQSAEMVISGLRPPVFFKQQPNLIRHAKSWTMENSVKAIKLLISAELDCKTSDLPAAPTSSRKLLKITQLR